MNCRLTDEGVAAGDGGSAVRVRAPGWEGGSVSPRPVSTDDYDVLRLSPESLRFPLATIAVLDETGRRIGTHDSSTAASDYESPIRLRVDAQTPLRCWVDTPAAAVTVETDGEEIEVDALGRLHCWIGALSGTTRPTVRVPESIRGFAEALSVVHGGTERSPLRTSPREDTTPAPVEWTDHRQIPEQLSPDRRPEVVFRLPADLAEMAVAAPLVYYLRGAVSVGPMTTAPTLQLNGEEFDVGRNGEYTPQQLLQYVFWLDRLVRCGHREGREVARFGLLDSYGLDPERLLEESPASRLRRYLDVVEPATVLDEFPEWHFAVSVAPSLENVRSLLPLLDRWPVVTVAEHDGETEDVPMARDDEPMTSSITHVTPASVSGRTHGWLAPNVPTEGFVLLPDTVEPGHSVVPSGGSDEGERLEIVVASHFEEDDSEFVDTTAELEAATSAFEGRDGSFEITVDRLVSPTVDELASTFESSPDLVHFIGHADADAGLSCVDGGFLPETLSGTETTAFFLDACETHPIGRSLIEAGATAGVVTRDIIYSLDSREVGRDWARLVARGWPVASALERAQAPRDSDEYVAIGDGTRVIALSDAKLPPTVTVESPTDGRYRVEIVHDQPILPGAAMSGDLNDGCRVPGDGSVHELDRRELHELLDQLDSPVTVDGSLRWPNDQSWV